jgi:hypothetical protein
MDTAYAELLRQQLEQAERMAREAAASAEEAEDNAATWRRAQQTWQKVAEQLQAQVHG